jgi:hypothetical protein
MGRKPLKTEVFRGSLIFIPIQGFIMKACVFIMETRVFIVETRGLIMGIRKMFTPVCVRFIEIQGFCASA